MVRGRSVTPRRHHGDARGTIQDTLRETAALRSKVSAEFIPLFDHLLNLAKDDIKRSDFQSAGQLLRQARKYGGETKAMRPAAKSQKMSRRYLAEKMSKWGSDFSYGKGPGSIGAVSSYYVSDMVYPNRTIVERALAEVEKDIPLAEHGAHGWTRRDAGELRTIAKGLRYFLHHDYS